MLGYRCLRVWFAFVCLGFCLRWLPIDLIAIDSCGYFLKNVSIFSEVVQILRGVLNSCGYCLNLFSKFDGPNKLT